MTRIAVRWADTLRACAAGMLLLACGAAYAADEKPKRAAEGAEDTPVAVADASTGGAAAVAGSATAAGGTIRLPDTTITATKSEREIDDTPGSVSVTTREQLDRRLADDLNDVLRYLPGVQVDNGPRRVGQRPNIRGLGGSRVLQTIDGARINFDSGHKGSGFMDPSWFKRVEVIRGPASALYGSGAIGGAVNYRTIEGGDLLDDGDLFGARMRVGFEGANKQFSVSPTVFGRLDRDGPGSAVDYILSYTGRWSDDYRMGNGETLENSDDDINSGLAKFVWRVNDETTIKFGTMQFHDQHIVPPNLTTMDPTTVDRTTMQSFYNLEFSHYNSEVDWLNIEGNVYFNSLDLDEVRTADGRNDEVDFGTAGLDVRNRQYFDFDEHNRMVLTYGFEYFRDWQDSTRDGGHNGFFPGARANYFAGYVQAELALFDELLTLVPGLRVDHVTKDGDEDIDGNTYSSSDTAVSPKIGGVLTLDDEINLADGDYVALTANYARGFRVPTFSELFASGEHFAASSPFSPAGVFIPSPDLEPEITNTWEAGVRAKLDDFRFRGTYWETYGKDFIATDVTFNPFDFLLEFEQVNVPKAKLHGVELEAEWAFYEDWLAWGNYTRIRGEDKSTGEPLDSIPADKITLGLDYYWRELNLSPGLRVNYYWPNDRSSEPEIHSDSAVTLDLVVSWQPQTKEPDLQWINNFRVDVFIENVTDSYYTPYLSGVPEAGINPGVAVTWTKTW